MPRNRKFFIHKKVVLITSRTEEGLPLVPNALVNTILWSILARARSLYDVKICHFIFMSNHLHIVAVVDDPEDLPRFMRYLKGESAHAINKLLGRTQRTVWTSRYDSPTILTAADVFRYINYIYTNPQKANLVESIDDYPGVSSWRMFMEERELKECPKIRRETIPSLEGVRLTKSLASRILSEIIEENKGSSDFILEPYAFLECFDETRDLSKVEAREIIIKEVKKRELYLNKNRKTSVLGVSKLIHQDIGKEYQPRVRGRRMICISSDKALRGGYISWFRSLCRLASKAYDALHIRNANILFPPGVFMPGGGLSSNFNSSFFLC